MRKGTKNMHLKCSLIWRKYDSALVSPDAMNHALLLLWYRFPRSLERLPEGGELVTNEDFSSLEVLMFREFFLFAHQNSKQ